MKAGMPDAAARPRVAVVYGGPGEEREVSLESGVAVAGALEGEGFTVSRVVIDGALDGQLEEIERSSDVVFLALHGRYGEDGTAQSLLESAGIPYTGSGPDASRAAMEKPEAKRLFQDAGLRTPKYQVVEDTRARESRAKLLAHGLDVPLVVKPAASGSSVGVTIVRDAEALGCALEKALAYGPRVVVEEFIAGREVSVAVLEHETLPPCELVTSREFYDYAAKYEDDATQVVCPAELDAEATRRTSEAALRAFDALGCRDFGRTDVILGTDGLPWVLEVNTIPGFTSHSLVPRAARAAGVEFGRLCARIVRLAAHRAGQRKGDEER
jgi:D-alanine-D-alanine ligase